MLSRINRIIKFSTKFRLIKKKPLQAYVSFLFVTIPLLLAIPMYLIFTNINNDIPHPDYDQLVETGTATSGSITAIETRYNMTINGEHPSIISFSYEANGEDRDAVVQVLDPTKVSAIKEGDTVSVKYLQQEAVIIGYRPYQFPFGFLLLIPLPFLLIGIPFLISLWISVSKELKLYRNGEVKEGEILALIPNSGFAFTNFGQSITVHYQYEDTMGNNHLGKSRTTDFSILGEKKKGNPVRILVSETDESKSCLYPELEAIENNWDD